MHSLGIGNGLLYLFFRTSWPPLRGLAIGVRPSRLTACVDALDQKFCRYFLWIIGIQITVLLAVIGALLGR